MVFRHSTLAILKDTCTCLVCLFCWRWAYPLTSACSCRGSWCTGYTDAAAAAAARALAPDKSFTTSPQPPLSILSKKQPSLERVPCSPSWNNIPAYNPCWDDRFGLAATVAIKPNRSSQQGLYAEILFQLGLHGTRSSEGCFLDRILRGGCGLVV